MRILWYWPHPHRDLYPAAAPLLDEGDSLVVQCLETHRDDGDSDDQRVTFRRELPEVRDFATVPVGVRRLLRFETYVRRAVLRDRLVRSQEFDVCHVHVPNYLTDAWSLPRLRRRVPVVLVVHDAVPHEERLPKGLEQRVLERVYRSADVCVVLHEIVGDRLVEEFGVPRGSIVVGHHAVSPVEAPDPPALVAAAAAGAARPPVQFLFFGTFRRDKGLPVLLEAARLVADDPSVRVHIAGGGDAELERIVGNAAATDVVTAEIGRISRRERKGVLFRSADVLVLPYADPERFQSQSGVLADSYAHGRPLIVTDVGALGPTVRGDGTGWVIPPADAEALAEALRSVAGDLDARRAATTAVIGARSAYSDYEFGRTLRSAYILAMRSQGARGRDDAWSAAPLSEIDTAPRDPADITFSVVIPTVGSPDVGNAVADALAQEHTQLEVVVVGDGVPAIPSALESVRDERLVFVAIEHSGPGAARNAGVRAATGEWIVFLDDDDRADPEWLSTLADLAARPDAGFLRCAGRIIVEEGGEILHSELIANRGGLAGTFAARRDVFDAASGYDPELRFGENTELCFRLTHACRARGLVEYRSEQALVTVQRHDAEAYPPDVLLASALRVLIRDAVLLERARSYRANLWGIAGVNAARLDDLPSARRYLLRAALTNPRQARAWVRAAAALVPGVARRRWAASSDG